MTQVRYLIILASIILSACSGKLSQREAKAVEMGNNDAQGFIELVHKNKTNEMQLQGFLIEVRQKEQKMLEVGYDSEAQKYIEAFKNTLHQKDSVLYFSIFEN